MEWTRETTWLLAILAGLVAVTLTVTQDGRSHPSWQQLEAEPAASQAPASFAGRAAIAAHLPVTPESDWHADVVAPEKSTDEMWPSLDQMDKMLAAMVEDEINRQTAAFEGALSNFGSPGAAIQTDARDGDARPRKATVIIEGPSGKIQLIETIDLAAN